jgi:hypothetical protein
MVDAVGRVMLIVRDCRFFYIEANLILKELIRSNTLLRTMESYVLTANIKSVSTRNNSACRVAIPPTRNGSELVVRTHAGMPHLCYCKKEKASNTL